MTDPARTAHEVLVKVAEFVRTLPADQLADLLSGAARLELVPKGAKITPATPAPASASSRTTDLPVPAELIAATLAAAPDRPTARRHLDAELRLSVPMLKILARELGISVAAKATRAQLLNAIVDWGVGRRLDSEAISRVAGRQPER